jgi:UDP-2-acetamido-2,6-beta-L-arabino-hexul-4-ose reductase
MYKAILITGTDGFIGKNLYFYLKETGKYNLLLFDKNNDKDDLKSYIREADFIFHLAGVNRPENDSEFSKVNFGLTSEIIKELVSFKKNIPIVFSSSTQAESDNEYGKSKKNAEDALIEYSNSYSAKVIIYRLTNVFGKWSLPNYNSVVSTFCHNIAHNLPITINNPEAEVKLVYIDDVIKKFISHLNQDAVPDYELKEAAPIFTISLQKIADTLYSFRGIRKNLIIPDMNDLFTKYLHTTYLSYLPENEFSYKPEERKDERGKLVELIKSKSFGQLFVSTTKNGIIRGNHYHHSKVEKFIVVKGRAVVRFKKIDSNKVLSYNVSDNPIEIIDIPPGYTHHIENVGNDEMIVLFWANEVFNPDIPDTHFLSV